MVDSTYHRRWCGVYTSELHMLWACRNLFAVTVGDCGLDCVKRRAHQEEFHQRGRCQVDELQHSCFVQLVWLQLHKFVKKSTIVVLPCEQHGLD